MSDSLNRQDVDSKRRTLLAALGGSASVGLAGCSAILGGDDGGDGDGDGDGGGGDGDGDGDGMDGDGDGTDGDGDGDGEEEPDSYADKAQAAWERANNNPLPEDQDIRTEAYIEMEEAIRDDMVMLPIMHPVSERFWYDYVDVPKVGGLGGFRQQHNQTTVEGDDTLNLINATFDTVDPVVSDDTASGEVINQMYERLTAFPNGVAELENKLITGVDVSDDALTYTFHLKEGVSFHGGGEMTADDVVYSFERVALSENSRRASFLLAPAHLGLEHDRNDDDMPVPDSLALEAVDDYTFEMTLQNPNPSALQILAYGSFSITPAGVVGDVPGYDGEVAHEDFQTTMSRGTGPFEFGMLVQGEEARVDRFDDYHGEVADLASVHWAIIEDTEASWTYATEGNADIFGVPTSKYSPDTINAETDDRGRDSGTYGPDPDNNLDEQVNYLAVSTTTTYYYAFHVPTIPRPVRRAYAYVFDQQTLVDEIFAGRGVPAFSMTPPALWPSGGSGYSDWLDDYPYAANETDIQSATQVLEEAGYTTDDPFSMTMTTYDSQVFNEAGKLIRDKVSGLGIEVELEAAQFATLQNRGQDGSLEMYTLGWIWDYPTVANGLYILEPKNTDTSKMPGDAGGLYIDWQTGLDEEA